MQNTAYSGTDLMLFSKSKVLAETRIAYFGLNFATYLFKLRERVLSLDFTSIGITS